MSRFRTETIGDCTLILGDCREVLPTLQGVEAVVSDPPYGMAWNTDSTRFSGGEVGHRRRMEGRADWAPVHGDDEPFDPAPFLHFPKVILWGANHYSARLPTGTTLIWIKRLDAAYGSFLSDAEVAWQKGGHGVYCRRDLTGYANATERFHPTQKPVGVMSWCVERVAPAHVILDPFMGSGTTGVACVNLSRQFVGVELHEPYFDIACRRIEEAYRQPRLFTEPAAKPVQSSFLEPAQ